ncbi:delta-lactam-biosynthetic de-N-acetylase [Vallitaleaceae bacterium 9-2]
MKLKKILHLSVVASLMLVLLTACQGELYTPDSASGQETDDYVEVRVEAPESETEETQDTQDTTQEVVDVEEVDEAPVETPEEEPETEALEEESEQKPEQGITVEFANQFDTEDTYDLELDPSTLDNTDTSWSFRRNKDHSPVTGYYDLDLERYGAYFINQEASEEKVMYLTFDEGYEYGFTPKILDVLKENDVQAAFFVTKYFIDKEPELIQRMVDEGHIVANHSNTHPAFPSLTGDEIYDELKTTNDRFKEVTGQDMDPFFRPPMGKYSERSLYLVRKLGYRSIFWSMAYADWDVNKQPGKEVAYNHVMDNYHNGAIILLHAVSESNTQALDDILKSMKEKGYRFGSLYELE